MTRFPSRPQTLEEIQPYSQRSGFSTAEYEEEEGLGEVGLVDEVVEAPEEATGESERKTKNGNRRLNQIW